MQNKFHVRKNKSMQIEKDVDVKKSIDYAFRDIRIGKKGSEIKNMILTKKSKNLTLINALVTKLPEFITKISTDYNLKPDSTNDGYPFYSYKSRKDCSDDCRKYTDLYHDIIYCISTLKREIDSLDNLNSMFEDNKKYDLSFDQMNALKIKENRFPYLMNLDDNPVDSNSKAIESY